MVDEQSIPSSAPAPDDIFERLFDLYIPPVKEKIRVRADEIATLAGHNSRTAQDVMKALDEYIPGEPYQPVKPRWGWINQNVTGFMAITAAMTLIFGVLGIMPQVKVEGFLEIAKIFAGALVGGAAGAAASARR